VARGAIDDEFQDRGPPGSERPGQGSLEVGRQLQPPMRQVEQRGGARKLERRRRQPQALELRQ
jgi:hypothetical protein